MSDTQPLATASDPSLHDPVAGAPVGANLLSPSESASPSAPASSTPLPDRRLGWWPVLAVAVAATVIGALLGFGLGRATDGSDGPGGFGGPGPGGFQGGPLRQPGQQFGGPPGQQNSQPGGQQVPQPGQ